MGNEVSERRVVQLRVGETKRKKPGELRRE